MSAHFGRAIFVAGISSLIVWGLIAMGTTLYKRKQFVITPDLIHSINTVEGMVALFPTSVAQIEAMAQKYIQQAHADIQTIIDVPDDQRTFANTAFALDRVSSFSNLPIASRTYWILKNLSPNKELRDAAHNAMMQVTNFYVDEVSSNKKLFNAFKAYANGNAFTEPLTEEQRYFVQNVMDDFVRTGLNLPEDELEKVKQLEKELAELSLVFAKNMGEDNRALEVEAEGLKGVDAHFVASLKRTEDGNYILGTDYPTRSAIMENCAVEDTRRRYSLLFSSRAYPQNHDVLQQFIAKRDQLARLLGFASYAHLDIADQMVQTPERAYSFLHDLADRATPKERKEIAEWTRDLPESVTLDAQGRIKPWDMTYLQTQYKKKYLSVDEDHIAEYFPMEKTVQGLLDIYKQFLSIDFQEISISGLWHEEVTLIAVLDKNKSVMGYLLLDLYPRENKYGHAAQATVLPAVIQNGVRIAPMIAVVIANFPKSTADQPSLLKRNDVNTFFHEFGHALHALCGATEVASFSGTAVKRDFVEMPSQMLEEWLWDKEILQKLSSHYKTGEPLPDSLIDSILALKAYDAGFCIKRQVFLSLIALDYFGVGEHKDPYAMWTALNTKMTPYFMPVKESYGYASFGHLTGYGAKYYGYLWSKVFAFDLFGVIKEQGLLNPVIGRKYITEVIGKGGSKDPNALLRTFLGREPRSDAFFASMGLKK